MDPRRRHEIWPVFDLRVRTPRVTLRPVDPDLAFDVADLAAQGIHDPEAMPFAVPWTDAPPDQLRRDSVRYLLGCWSRFEPTSWAIVFAVFAGGELVGVQDVRGDRFATLRQIETGSWLGRRFQGQGLGTEMRAAVLHLAFAGFGALRATTEAHDDNAPSLGVTRALGYRPNGSRWGLRRDEPVRFLQFVLEREDWAPRRRDDITIEGLDDTLRGFLGLP